MALVLDANLLLLFVVGSANEEYISKHKNLGAYDVDDYRRLMDLMKDAQIVITPHVIAETSNLLRQIKAPLKERLTSHFGALLGNVSETYIQSKSVNQRPEYPRLGVTDATILLALAQTGATLLTSDVHLYLAAAHAGYRSVNYNHVRDSDPDFNPLISTS